MTETFDAYTQRTRLYYGLQAFSLLTILGIAAGRITNLQVSVEYKPYLVFSVVSGLVVIVLNLLLTGMGSVKMNKKSGDLIISIESITINSTTIFLKDIQMIDIEARDYKGARASDGSGNRSEVRRASGQTMICRFVIDSKSQLNNLKQILEQWKASGVNVVLN